MTEHYGSSHMGCPIGFAYQSVTFPLMGTIGSRIRDLRKSREMTQPVLAKAVGIDQSTLSDIERGAGFSAEILVKLSEHLGTTPEYIMRGQRPNAEGLSPQAAAIAREFDTFDAANRRHILKLWASMIEIAKGDKPPALDEVPEQNKNKVAKKG